jgi:hypothetical protein
MKVESIARLCALATICIAPLMAGTFHVTLDTTPLAGVSGFLAFDLIGGSPLQSNIAAISGFTTSGTLGISSTSGNVTGTLAAPPVVLTASSFFNEYLQALTFASGLTTFNLSLTSTFITASAPDSFSFFLLDSSLAPIATSDPTGANTLFAIDITSATPTPDVFTSPSVTATVLPVTGGVPEPAAVSLMVLGLGALVARRVTRRLS